MTFQARQSGRGSNDDTGLQLSQRNQLRSGNFSSSVPVRRPVVWATTALACGCLIEEKCGLPARVWELSLCASVLLAGILYSRNSSSFKSSVAVLLMLLTLGGLRLNSFLYVRAVDNIARFCRAESQPARLLGVLSSEVELIEAERGPRIPPWMELDVSRFILKVEQIGDGAEWISTSGTVRVDLGGHLVHARIGDRIDILGQINRAQPNQNPGGFNFATYLQRQGIDALLRAEHPQAVQVLGRDNAWIWPLRQFRDSIRAESRSLFTQNLSKKTNPLALSLLLGDRSLLNDELRDRFVESGTMHLLAISGLHVGILAGLLAFLCRLFGVSARTAAVTVVLVVGLYALLTNHRPPVLRATLLVTVVCIGVTERRHIDGMNVLAFCGGVLLLWKPTDLFDIGAQLSFLAVGAIIWSAVLLKSDHTVDPLDGLPLSENWQWLSWLKPVQKFLHQGYVVTGAVWLATLPLTISTFHLVTPIGFLLNIFLIPFVAAILILGYLFFIIGILLPMLASSFAIPFDWSLQALLSIVDGAHQLPYGHYACSGIPKWWLFGFYLLLAMAWRIWGGVSHSAWAWRALLLWCLFGLGLALQHSPRDGLRYTVLSVGHGLASVIELPTGETILYDVGTFGDGRRAERTVEQYLWARNVNHLDGVVLSHADHDHFSGLFGLMDRFTIGTIFIPQAFLDFEQSSVLEICERAALQQIPVRIVAAEDQLSAGDHTSDVVQIRVLHPAHDFRSKHDNANSLCLSLSYAGRSLLLTGDLEKDGLERFMEQVSADFDVVMAPHHGSRFSSPQQFFDWAAAKYVIISSGDAEPTARLQAQLGQETRVLGTDTSGAITVEVNSRGILKVHEFLDEEN